MSHALSLLALAAGFQSGFAPAYAPAYTAPSAVTASAPAPVWVAAPAAAAPAPAMSNAAFLVPALAFVTAFAVAANGAARPVAAAAVSGRRAVALRPRFAPAAMVATNPGSGPIGKDSPGVTAPLGYFDPLGFSTNASPETMAKYREAELKHGRVAMLASLGMIVADKWHPLFDGKNSSNPLLALTQVPKLGWLQILTFIMFIEVLGILNTRRPDYQPGDFLGSNQWELGEPWKNYQTKELNNGRLAMFGSIGMLVGSYITGKGPLEVTDTIVF